MEDGERGSRRRLVRLAAADDRAQRVGGDHLRRGEMTAGERRLAGARRADEHYQRWVGQDDDAPAVRGFGASQLTRRASSPPSPARTS